MASFIIKGTAIGFDSQKWKEDKELFSSILLSATEAWRSYYYDCQGGFNVKNDTQLEREYGRVQAAIWGLENDIHNLAVNIHMIQSSLKNSTLEEGLKILYSSLLVENYVINLRSIYDFSSFLPRIIMPLESITKYQKRRYPDSLNTFIKFCKSIDSECLPKNLLEKVKNSEPHLNNVKTIRDLIIHKGKEPIIKIDHGEAKFRMPPKQLYGKGNALPDILNLGQSDYPVLPYLRSLTTSLFVYLEDLGIELVNVLNEDEKFNISLTALVGICIEPFNSFLHDDLIKSNK